MKISVITPSYNSGKYIKRAIQSVLNQTYTNYEHIIIDGLSNDKTLKILKQFPHLKWISEKDTGQSNAMNKGFNLSAGDVIVYLNADDYFLPDAFESVIPYFQKGEKFIVGDVILRGSKIKQNIIKPNVEFSKMLRHWEPRAFPNNPVQYFYLREVQEKIKFNEDNHLTMDIEFLLEASHKYKLCKIDKTLGVYLLLKNAKYVSAQKKPFEYWNPDNYSFIDKYLIDLSKDEIIKFKNDQFNAYMQWIKYIDKKLFRRIFDKVKSKYLKINYK